MSSFTILPEKVSFNEGAGYNWSHVEITNVTVDDFIWTYDVVDYNVVSGATQGNFDPDTVGEIIWYDFDFEPIPGTTAISAVKVVLKTADVFMYQAEDINATYTWELISQNGVVLATDTYTYTPAIQWDAFAPEYDLASITTEDIRFTDKGSTVIEKEGGGAFTKADLIGAKLKYTITNDTPFGEGQTQATTLVDSVSVVVEYIKIKQVIMGYMDRKGRPTGTGLDICDSYVANLGPGTQDGIQWQWIMTASTQTAALTAILNELEWAQANGFKVKLRIFNPPPASLNASVPAVAHSGTGTLPSGDCANGQLFDQAGYTIEDVRFWHDTDFITAYAALHTLLADRFDSHPALGDVAFMGGTLEFAEPMVRQITVIDSKRAQYLTWQTAGSPNSSYVNSDKISLKLMMNAHSVWEQTPQSLACNPYQTITLGTCGGLPKYIGNIDNNVTFELAEYWCNLLGKRAVIGNNSIRPNGPDSNYPPMYQGLMDICEETGARMYFQTASTANLNNQIFQKYQGQTLDNFDEVLDATIAKCRSYGALYVELPSNYKDPGVTLPTFP